MLNYIVIVIRNVMHESGVFFRVDRMRQIQQCAEGKVIGGWYYSCQIYQKMYIYIYINK